MAITTLDGALAGMQPVIPFAKSATPTLVAGRPASTWYLGGSPGAGAAPANTNGGTVLSSSSSLVTGQIYHQDPGSGNSYLARLSAIATQSGMLLLCDRLLQCAGTTAGSAISITSTSAQQLNTTTLPARDANGATTGVGVQAAVEIITATGAGTPTLTMHYNDANGATNQTATNIDSTVASSAIGAFYRLGLVAGGTGVEEVTQLTLSASWTSGTLCIVLYRVIAALELPGALIPNAIDSLTSGFPQLFNGTVPFLVFIPNTTTATAISGSYIETQG